MGALKSLARDGFKERVVEANGGGWDYARMTPRTAAAGSTRRKSAGP
jgi:hypothetical protein